MTCQIKRGTFRVSTDSKIGKDVAMADGDIVHRGLRRLYHKPYKWLCEGACTSDECARLVLELHEWKTQPIT